MKRLLAGFFLVVVLALPSLAQDKGFGLGIAIGEPDGIVGKYWITDRHAIDFGLGMSIGPTRINSSGNKENAGSRIHLRADYLLHNPDAIQSSEQFPLYIGGGAYLETGGAGDDLFGLRGVAGLAYWVRQAPLELYLEVAPTLQLEPTVGLGFLTSIGVRYYFGQ